MLLLQYLYQPGSQIHRQSDTRETNPPLTLPLVGMTANAEEGVGPICIVTDLEPSK